MRLIIGELIAIAVLLPAIAAIIPALRDGRLDPREFTADGSMFASTVGYAVIAGVVAVGVGGVVAAGASRLPGRFATTLTLASLLPLLVPASLMATGWIMALGRDGVVTVAAANWGVHLPTAYDWPVPAILAGCRTAGVPAMILLLAWRRLRSSVSIERAFGVPLWQRWWWLRIIPLVSPLAVAWLLAFLLVLVDPILPGMLLTHTYATQMLIEYNAMMDSGGAAQLALPLAAMGLAAGVLAWRLRPSPPSFEAALMLPPRRRADTVVATVVSLAVIAACVGVPIVALAVRAESLASIGSAAREGSPELLRTLQLTTVGAAVAASIGAVLAAHGCWMKAHGRPSLVPLVLINVALPPTMLGIGCLELGSRPELSWMRGDAMLITGYVARFAPLATIVLLVLWSRQSGRVAVVAARRLGVPPLHVALRIVGPARLRDTALIAVLISLPLLSEVELSILLAPPGVTTLGVRLYTMIHTSPDSAVSSLAIIVLSVTVSLTLLSMLAFRVCWPKTPSEAGE